MKYSRWILICLSMPFLVGYKIYPGGNAWGITSSDPKIYLRFCQNTSPTTNDVESGDTLSGQTVTHTNIVSSIVTDYTLTTSFVRLADSATDNSFNSTTHAERIIDICTGGTGVFDGYAQQKWEGSKVVGCDITLGTFSHPAKKLLRILEHEIGHCLGLDHPQETKYALMSYFSDSESVYRLQGDDKAALMKLYPAVSDYEQKYTMGASCAAQ